MSSATAEAVSRAVGCAAVALALVVLGLRCVVDADHRMSTAGVAQVNIATAQALGVLLYPVLWGRLIGWEMLASTPLAAGGLVWPLVLLLLDLKHIEHQTIEHEGVNKKTVFHFDSGAVQGLAFGIGGLVASNMGSHFAKSLSPVFSVCILICIGLLMPTPGVQSSTLNSITFAAVQKVSITFCVGLLMTAIAMNLNFCMKARKRPSRCVEEALSAETAAAERR